MGVPVNPLPPPPNLIFSMLLWKKKVPGSRKMAWIDAVRTTHYSLILMLRCDVFTFVVKQEVPNDEDVEWLYPSCSLYEKEFKSFSLDCKLEI